MVDWTNTKRKHGTSSGYQLHKQLGEDACRRCVKAATENSRMYRERNRSKKAKRKNLLMARAQSFARTELVQNHPAEYRRLYKKHKALLGV